MRKHKRKTRRRQYVSLFALGESQSIARLAKEARSRYSAAVADSTPDERDLAATEKALAEADEVTEVMLVGVPLGVAAAEVVAAIMDRLFQLGLVDDPRLPTLYSSSASAASPVLSCTLQTTARNVAVRAYVSLRREELAQLLVECSQIEVNKVKVKVVKSSRRVTVPGMGTAWHTNRDPGSMRWKVGNVQVGDRVSEHCFAHFWTASPFPDLSGNNHVELSPVSKVLSITVGRQQKLLRATPDLKGFVGVVTMLRIAIPFQAICGDPFVETKHQWHQGQVISIPVSRPPLLYRAQEKPSYRKSVSAWDCLGGSSEEIFWVRTIDPTPSCAFSRARLIRVTLEDKDLYSFYKQLYKACLVKISRPIAHSGKSLRKTLRPDRQLTFRAAAKLGIPFSVRYMVECILSLGQIQLDCIDTNFWSALSDGLVEDSAVAALDWMHFRLTGTDAITTSCEALDMLLECISMVQLQDADSSSTDSSTPGYIELDSDIGSGALLGGDGQFTSETNITKHRLEKLENDVKVSPIAHSNSSKALTGAQKHMLQPTCIRRVICTPTTIVSLKPESDTLNRVLREFSEHRDRFLRVSFADENGAPISYESSDDLYARVRVTLRDGIQCGGEEFVFLAFSSSQLRDHSVWMYNETSTANSWPPSADKIRAWMGDFSKIRVPAKFAARQGQTFSATVGTVRLQESEKVIIDDVLGANEKYAFSDGVGIISSAAGRSVVQNLNMISGCRIPSAFQVRIGGAKGMLTVWDEALPKNCRAQVALRPSMVKFVSSHSALEIVSCSKRLPLFLNRQIIMILSGMGVPDSPFEKLQAQLLHHLDRAMDHDGAAVAIYLLDTSGCADSDNKLQSSAPMTNAASFFRAGLTCVNCEHLRNVMDAFRLRTIQDLMDKARIPVDSNKGFCALGVMDELGILAKDEVFCQYKEPGSGKILLVEGRVTVGRNPSLHPGDIRPLNAVNRSSLRHLIDVIVFSQKGSRPVPSMLSGGDLDGDVFFCIFDERIPFPNRDPYPPMDYTAPDPVTTKNITTANVADFFVNFVRHDKLGQIATAHMVHADREKEGIFSSKCLTLAQLHSTAVDFAKSGIPPQFPRDLQLTNKRNQFPDFVGKHPKVSYKSKKVLGKLYRACVNSRESRGKRQISFPNTESLRVDLIIESFPRDEEFAEEAESLCDAYNVELMRIMEQYGVKNEGELISGQVLSFSARHLQLCAKRNRNTMLTRLNRQAGELRTQFRELFFAGLGQTTSAEYNEDTILKACEWYRVCNKQAQVDRESGKVPLLSFPWVVSDILLNIVAGELGAP